MLRPPRHPHQVTTLPQPHQPVRNPWVEKPESSTNSSCGSRSGRSRNTILQHSSEWALPRSQTLSHQGPLLNHQVHPIVVSSVSPGSGVSGSGRGSSGVISATGGMGSCGGQCGACETFCYYCLQVMFIAGILTGIALTIAGSVLHGSQKEGDLVVLMYIGVLLVLVCILLLSVHCCVRKNVKERKRNLRMSLMEGAHRTLVHSAGDFTLIPVQDFTANPQYRNSFAEANVNDFELSDKPRPILNAITNPTHHYQYRQNSLNRQGASRVHAQDDRFEGPERQPFAWGTSYSKANVHRSFR